MPSHGAAQPEPVAARRKRVLIVSHVFPPLVAGGAPRMGQFARLLPDAGWDVTVITGEAPETVAVDRKSAAAIADRARVLATWSPASKVVRRGAPVAKHGVAGLTRRAVRTAAASVLFPDREVFWVPGAIAAGRRALREVPHDAVLATYGPASNLLVGRALASAFELPLVVDFRDLWSTLPLSVVFPTPLHRAAAYRIEHAIVRKASRLLAVAPAMARDLARTHGLDAERAVSITNGFDPADAAAVRDTRGPEPRPFRLVYTGTVHVHYDMSAFFRAVRSMADRGELTPATFRVEFVGNLSPREVTEHGVDSFVELSPFVPRAQLFEALARADAHLVVETPGYYAQYGYAAKVFDYVLTGKPVVGVVDPGGNTDSLLRAMGVGFCAAPGDTAGIEQALRDVMSRKGAPPRPVDPDASPLRDFNRRHLVTRLAEVLDDAIQTEPRGRW